MGQLLSQKAMLADYDAGTYDGRRFNKEASKETAQNHGVEYAGNFNQILFIGEGHVHLKRLSNIATQGRDLFYSLPQWGKGLAILPSSLYFDFQKKVREITDNFNKEADEFQNKYDTYIEEARAHFDDKAKAAGKPSLFDKKFYPTKAEVRDRFYITVSYSPIPEAGHFLVDLDNEELDKIKADTEAHSKNTYEQAIKKAVQKLADPLKNIVERLSNEKGIFHDSLIGNVTKIVSMIPAFNIMNDPELTKIQKDIESYICSVDPKDLRKDAGLKAETKKKAEEMLAALAGYTGL